MIKQKTTTPSDFQNIAQYENMLRPYAYSLTQDHYATEDLLQDTLYRALANKSKFEEGTNIKAWLFTIMRNIFINNYRRNRKYKLVADPSVSDYIRSEQQPVRNDASRKFLAEDIERAMNAVSEDFTRMFMLYYKGYKYQEIAEQFQLPLGTVKSRIFFARKELQSQLQQLGFCNSSY